MTRAFVIRPFCTKTDADGKKTTSSIHRELIAPNTVSSSERCRAVSVGPERGRRTAAMVREGGRQSLGAWKPVGARDGANGERGQGDAVGALGSTLRG
jgi:hypothetical protein